MGTALKTTNLGGELAQEYFAPAQDLGLAPSRDMVAHDHPPSTC